MTSTGHAQRPRVVVTGIGVKTPAGLTTESFWATVLAARPTAAPVTLFDAGEHSVDFACEVGHFDPVSYVGEKEVRRTDRATLLGLAAASDAIVDAGGNSGGKPDTGGHAGDQLAAEPQRRAVVAGSGVGGIRSLEDQIIQYASRGPNRTSPFLVPMMMTNATAATIAMHQGWTGPNMAIATACATGANAIGEGARLIRDDLADVVVCGGTEASISPVAMAAFARMGALSRNPDHSRASRPFDIDRDGFVMGEGAGFVVLEALEHAIDRGATIHGELLGYAMTCDAHHITAPLDDGAGAASCMKLALADAGLQPSAIGHVNAHGTSTPQNDAAEAAAVAKVFGEAAVPITSTKGVTGHLIGAAGAVEAIATLLATQQGVVPPTANHERCDLPVDVVAGEARVVGPAPALSSSFAFGGHNVALVIGPPPD